MNSYDFTLKFALLPEYENREELETKLYEAGCDDALIGTGVACRIALNFTREATTASDAVFSAIRDVKKALPGAELIEVSPDLVGLTDIAQILGCSRQYVRKIVFESTSPPLPFHEGNPTLWHLVDMLKWFEERRQNATKAMMFDLDILLDLAQLNKSINACRTETDPAVREQLKRVSVAIR